jgi:hypothetical protein
MIVDLGSSENIISNTTGDRANNCKFFRDYYDNSGVIDTTTLSNNSAINNTDVPYNQFTQTIKKGILIPFTNKDDSLGKDYVCENGIGTKVTSVQDKYVFNETDFNYWYNTQYPASKKIRSRTAAEVKRDWALYERIMQDGYNEAIQFYNKIYGQGAYEGYHMYTPPNLKGAYENISKFFTRDELIDILYSNQNIHKLNMETGIRTAYSTMDAYCSNIALLYATTRRITGADANKYYLPVRYSRSSYTSYKSNCEKAVDQRNGLMQSLASHRFFIEYEPPEIREIAKKEYEKIMQDKMPWHDKISYTANKQMSYKPFTPSLILFSDNNLKLNRGWFMSPEFANMSDLNFLFNSLLEYKKLSEGGKEQEAEDLANAIIKLINKYSDNSFRLYWTQDLHNKKDAIKKVLSDYKQDYINKEYKSKTKLSLINKVSKIEEIIDFSNKSYKSLISNLKSVGSSIYSGYNQTSFDLLHGINVVRTKDTSSINPNDSNRIYSLLDSGLVPDDNTISYIKTYRPNSKSKDEQLLEVEKYKSLYKKNFIGIPYENEGDTNIKSIVSGNIQIIKNSFKKAIKSLSMDIATYAKNINNIANTITLSLNQELVTNNIVSIVSLEDKKSTVFTNALEFKDALNMKKELLTLSSNLKIREGKVRQYPVNAFLNGFRKTNGVTAGHSSKKRSEAAKADQELLKKPGLPLKDAIAGMTDSFNLKDKIKENISKEEKPGSKLQKHVQYILINHYNNDLKYSRKYIANFNETILPKLFDNLGLNVFDEDHDLYAFSINEQGILDTLIGKYTLDTISSKFILNMLSVEKDKEISTNDIQNVYKTVANIIGSDISLSTDSREGLQVITHYIVNSTKMNYNSTQLFDFYAGEVEGDDTPSFKNLVSYYYPFNVDLLLSKKVEKVSAYTSKVIDGTKVWVNSENLVKNGDCAINIKSINKVSEIFVKNIYADRINKESVISTDNDSEFITKLTSIQKDDILNEKPIELTGCNYTLTTILPILNKNSGIYYDFKELEPDKLNIDLAAVDAAKSNELFSDIFLGQNNYISKYAIHHLYKDNEVIVNQYYKCDDNDLSEAPCAIEGQLYYCNDDVISEKPCKGDK